MTFDIFTHITHAIYSKVSLHHWDVASKDIRCPHETPLILNEMSWPLLDKNLHLRSKWKERIKKVGKTEYAIHKSCFYDTTLLPYFLSHCALRHNIHNLRETVPSAQEEGSWVKRKRSNCSLCVAATAVMEEILRSLKSPCTYAPFHLYFYLLVLQT